MNIQKQEKLLYPEIARILAVFFIISLHTGDLGTNAYVSSSKMGLNYYLSFLYNVISNMGVPLFWMISGVTLLGKIENASLVYKKRLPRILLVLVLFSFGRYCYTCFYLQEYSFHIVDFFKKLLSNSIFVPYWFLYAYIGVLLILPFVRKITTDFSQKDTLILVLLTGIFKIVFPLFSDFCHINIGISLLLEDAVIYMLWGWVLGKQLENKYYCKKIAVLAWIFEITILAFVCILQSSQPIGSTKYASLFVMPLTIGLFYLIKYYFHFVISSSGKFQNIIICIGSTVFGIYLLEDYVRNITKGVHIFLEKYITSVPACFLWVPCVIFVSSIIVLLLKKVPLLKKIL